MPDNIGCRKQTTPPENVNGNLVMTSSSDQPVIFGMSAYPEPDNAGLDRYTERPIVKANPDRPELPCLFEVKGWVSGGFFQKFETGIGKFLNVLWKGFITLPESWRGKMGQSCLHRPLL